MICGQGTEIPICLAAQPKSKNFLTTAFIDRIWGVLSVGNVNKEVTERLWTEKMT